MNEKERAAIARKLTELTKPVYNQDNMRVVGWKEALHWVAAGCPEVR